MAVFTGLGTATPAEIGIDFTDIGLYGYVENHAGYAFQDNINATYYGIVYEDIITVDKFDGVDHHRLIIGGTGFVFNGSGELVAGTVTGLIVYDLGADIAIGRLEGISVPATDLYAAMFTSSNADDYELLRAALVGNDSFSMGEGRDNITGFTGNDVMYGNGGADTIDGAEGNDTLYGGTGNDSLLGGAGYDSLVGNADNDTLNGGADDDTMAGGGGNDTYYLDSAGDRAIELPGAGFDLIRTNYAITNLLDHPNIEALTYYGTGNATLNGAGAADSITGGDGNDSISGFGGNDTLYGGYGNDRIFGNAGDDSIDGSAGNDAMFGGDGNDSYVVDSVGDRVVELAGQGFDEVRTTLTYVNLWSYNDQVEALSYTGTGNATIRGALADNLLTGNVGNDSLLGFGGDDTIWGAGGNDLLTGDNGADQIFGDDGNDTIFGGAGNDTIQGGGGRDFMTGKGGADVFLFSLGDYSGSGTTDCDRIEDFVQGEDHIDMRMTGLFTFIGTAGFGNVAGELRYEQTATSTMIYGDTDGDGTADFAIKLAGLVALTAGDFLL